MTIDKLTLGRVCEILEAELYDHSGQRITDKIAEVNNYHITSVATLEAAVTGQISFYHNSLYYKSAIQSKATAIITSEVLDNPNSLSIKVKNPYAAWATILNKLYPVKHTFQGVSEKAFVHATSKIGKNVIIYPGVYIDERTEIGDNTVIYPNVVVGADSKIGSDGLIYANVVIRENTLIGHHVIIQPGAILGGDGFGFAPSETMGIIKVPQIGRVRIGNHVEIGANVCIDRAAVEETIIEDFVKLDNLIQIGHGVKVGAYSVIAAQFAAAGGVEIGQGFLAGGQTTIAGHIKIPPKTTLGGRAAVASTPKESGLTLMGYPAIEINTWRRLQVYLKKLPELFEQVKLLNKEKGIKND